MLTLTCERAQLGPKQTNFGAGMRLGLTHVVYGRSLPREQYYGGE